MLFRIVKLQLSVLTLYSKGYIKIMTSFSIFRQYQKKFKKNLSEVLNASENIMENGAFAPMEQMLDFPWYFQIHSISKDAIMG